MAKLIREKILFEYEDGIESIWSIKVDSYYKIDNIPFFTKNIALGDIVSVRNDSGTLYFDKLVTPSFHSVIQIIFFSDDNINEITTTLVGMGCAWEGSHLKSLIAVDVPPIVNYNIVKDYLDKEAEKQILDYREACLGSIN